MKKIVLTAFRFFSLFFILVNTTVVLCQEAPHIIKRVEWGARNAVTETNITSEDIAKTIKPITTYSFYGSTVVPDYTRVILHSTNTLYNSTGCGAMEARYAQYHEMNDGKFKADIGYNFLIDRCGNIYEGRDLVYFPSHAGATVEAGVQRNLSKDPDYGSIGVAFIGCPEFPLTFEQVEAAKKLISFYITHYCVNEVLTRPEVKLKLEDGTLLGEKLTPKGNYDAYVNPGAGTMEGIISIRNYFRNNFSIPFDEDAYRSLF